MGEAAHGAAQVRTRRQRVGEGLALKVVDLAPHRAFVRGFRAAGELQRPEGRGKAPETIAWEVAVDASFSGWIRFTHRRADGSEAASYSVALVAVEHPFGPRWAYRCSSGLGLCNALHLPPGAERFASRTFHSLSYQSQAMSRSARAASKAFAIRAALGGAADLGLPFPARPKRMRHATYERHRREVDALMAQARGRRARGEPAMPAAL